MPNFDIDVTRIGVGFATLRIQANTLQEAQEKALDEAGDHSFSEKTSEYELTHGGHSQTEPSPQAALEGLDSQVLIKELSRRGMLVCAFGVQDLLDADRAQDEEQARRLLGLVSKRFSDVMTERGWELIDAQSAILERLGTPEKCLAAVQANGLAIAGLTPEQRTPEVCLAAVQQDGRAIVHLTEEQRTPAVCLAAVLQNGLVIARLTDAQRTPEVCRSAVQQDGWAIQHLTDQQRTPELCLAAVRRSGFALQYLLPEQRTPEVCLAAVMQDGWVIKHLTPDQCAQAGVSDWVEANWDQCVFHLGKERALELARAMVSAAQEQDKTTQARERFAG
jgi:sorbitol-specific phosphotransferase system component IIBC